MSTSHAAITSAALVGGWLVCYLIVVLATRPTTVRAAAATPELGPEPPAVVTLLANRWRLTGDAAEATLLDLAARRILELRQAGDDPVDTTVHIRQERPDGLLPYERHLLDRIRRLAVNGVVPVTALAFRDRKRAMGWDVEFRRKVVADARRRGLSRRRIGPLLTGVLLSAAVVATAGPVLLGFSLGGVEGAFIGAVTFAVLLLLTTMSLAERDTPDGVAAAARWLGVREWLRAHEAFRDLPPAAVMVWDRYLPYGAALGVTETTSAVLDLGMGDRRRVWSSYGGRWRRVRVRYPAFVPHLGCSSGWMTALAVGALLFGGLHLLLARVLLPTGVPAGWWMVVVGPVLTGYGIYLLARSLWERGHEREITGQVLWVREWRRRWTSAAARPRGCITWRSTTAAATGPPPGACPATGRGGSWPATR